ncbi:hypothetical protein A2U01_0080376, partial [Trifolium medium]|nr:hypothetical protein [Trifolium medium]
MWLTSGMG